MLKKELDIDRTLGQILQILSITLFVAGNAETTWFR